MTAPKREASRTSHEAIDALIKRSSIGAAIDDIKARGIDEHMADLEREMRGPITTLTHVPSPATRKRLLRATKRETR